MDTSYIGDLQDLFGYWSFLALAIGFGGAFVSYCLWKRATVPLVIDDRGGKVLIAVLPWAMWLLAILVGVFILAASKAYSGPVAFEYREIWRFDKYYAALIALVFAFVFEFDSMRIPELRRRLSTWLCLLLCLGAFWFFLGNFPGFQ
jgi:hypothetical protein